MTPVELDTIFACGCRRVRSVDPHGGWWQGETCSAHERPGGWESWNAYRQVWRTTECCVCHRLGFQGRNDFESVWAGTGMMYAHRSCYAMANVFEDMRPPREWVDAYRKKHHQYA